MTTVVTPEQIAEAEAVLADAEEALDRAEEAHELVHSKTAAGELAYCKGQAHNARDRLRSLRTGYARQEEQRRARQAAEAGFAGEVEAAAAKLAAAREDAARAVVEARVALGALMAACSAYEATVRDTAAGMRQRGLVADEPGVWGATRGSVVRLPDGEHHHPLTDGGVSLLGELVGEAVRQADPRHPLARQRLADTSGPGALSGRRALLDTADKEPSRV